MQADDLDDPRPLLRAAAPRPTRPVDPEAIIARGHALDRRRTVGRAALVLLLAVPALAGVWLLRTDAPVDLAQGVDQGLVPATLSADEAPPVTLADGSVPPAVPEAVTARFAEPVVSTARLDALPRGLMAGSQDCTVPVSPTSASLERLRRSAGPAVVHVGPQTAATLAIGAAPAPPPYPDAYAIACLAVRHDESRLTTPGPVAAHLYRGWTGYVPPHVGDAGVPPTTASWMSALPVPPGASWAVQEHGGWWLAYDVTGDAWMLAQSSQPTPDALDGEFPGVRVVFLDTEGRTLGEERLGREAIAADAPFLRSQAADARIRFGDGRALEAELADGPVPACADDVTVCVWLVAIDGDIVALSAAGPVPAEVPPLGEVGWCPATERFHGRGVGSVYAPDGSWVAGPSRTGLHGYEVRWEDGAVVVDLSRFSFGAERDGQVPSAETADCADLVAPGFPLP